VASVIPSPPLGKDGAAGLLDPGTTTGAGPERAVAERRFRFELAAHPSSPAKARRLTRSRLTGWSVCEDTCDTADLVVSELVTNAIVHTASSRIVCELHDDEDLVRIAVRDEGCAPGEPHPSPQRPEEEHGRGLLLVEALCHAWGAQQHGPGLVVWAELPRTTGTQTHAGADAHAVADGPETWDTPAPSVTHEARDAYGTWDAHEAHAAHEAWGDLGWSARPKPVPVPAPPSQPNGENDPQAARRSPQAEKATHPHGARGTGATWL
jgi:hypothetical protein